MNPRGYGLYNPYQKSRYSFNAFQQPFPRYQPPLYPLQRPSFNPYKPPGIPYNWQIVNTPSQRRLPTFPENKFQDNAIWSSQWTEWLPASQVRWDVLKNRTFAKHNLVSISPKSFSGRPTKDATNLYKGLVKDHFEGIFPSKEDLDFT